MQKRTMSTITTAARITLLEVIGTVFGQISQAARVTLNADIWLAGRELFCLLRGWFIHAYATHAGEESLLHASRPPRDAARA